MTTDQPKLYDVAVIGAGPAGCSAALTLARKGLSVVLLEKEVLPHYKTCGGGVLHRAFKLLPPGVERVVERRFNSAQLNFLGTDLNFVVTRSEPIVHMTMRADLDCLLAREAGSAGAEIVESCPMRHATVRDQFVEISTDRDNYRSKFVIAADGVYSATAKAAGWQELPALAPALEYEIYLAEEDFERFGKMPRFDFNSIDAGYAWVFPKREHLSVGILSTRRTNTDLHAKLTDYLERLGIIRVQPELRSWPGRSCDATSQKGGGDEASPLLSADHFGVRIQKIEKHGYLIPLAPRRESLARGRVLLVGDAAGLVDPVTAEGISHAIRSGQLAATALADCQLDVSRAGKHYQSLLDTEILRELRAGRVLANVLYNYPRLRNWAFRVRGRELSEFVADVVMGGQNYTSALTKPSSYLKMFGLMR
jgi:geranylgeranyl reductase family protein